MQTSKFIIDIYIWIPKLLFSFSYPQKCIIQVLFCPIISAINICTPEYWFRQSSLVYTWGLETHFWSVWLHSDKSNSKIDVAMKTFDTSLQCKSPNILCVIYLYIVTFYLIRDVYEFRSSNELNLNSLDNNAILRCPKSDLRSGIYHHLPCLAFCLVLK